MILILVFGLAALSSAKIYDRCELARELKYVLNAPSHQVATWVCIAEHESQYNTSIVGYLSGDGSGDHGIFQINDKFWCSPPGKGYACGLTCAELEDDDISDDFLCAQRIYKEHKTLSGDGFNAWAVYKPHCKGSKAERYVKDCFKDIDSYVPESPTNSLSDFAHGFFGAVAGRANKGFSISTETPATFDAFFTPSTTSYYSPPAQNSGFYTPTVRTTSTFAPTTSSPTPNRFFFPPTTSSPTPNRFFFSSTTSTPTPSRFSFTPTTTTRLVPFARTSTLDTSRTFFTPSTTKASFFTSTTPRPFYQSSVSSNEPVFIINGVKWV